MQKGPNSLPYIHAYSCTRSLRTDMSLLAKLTSLFVVNLPFICSASGAHHFHLRGGSMGVEERKTVYVRYGGSQGGPIIIRFVRRALLYFSAQAYGSTTNKKKQAQERCVPANIRCADNLPPETDAPKSQTITRISSERRKFLNARSR